MENEMIDISAMKKYTTDGTPRDIVERYARLKNDAATSHYGALDEDVVVIDTETTGVSFNHDELTQIAAARMHNGTIVDWFVTFVNPGKPIPEDIAHLTNIHDEDVAQAPSPSEACADLARFVGGSYLVAHNSAFDRTFVTKNHGGAPLAENIWIDSLDLARIALPRLKSHRLIDLVHAFDAPVSTHRADADVEATCAVYRILLAGVAAMPPDMIGYIAELATPTEWPTVKVFKYFAQKFCDDRNAIKGSGEIDSPLLKQDFCNDEIKTDDSSEYRVIERASEKTSSSEPARDLDWVDLALAPMELETGSENASQDFLFADQETPKKLAARFDLRSVRRARIANISTVRRKVDALSIEMDPQRSLAAPKAEDVQNAFMPDGLVGSLYQHYEQREEQVAMAEGVRAAFADPHNLVVEAGTGVGKSMAYLVPAALMAQMNDISVGVATKTNALLDQLVNKELPALSRALVQQGKRPLSYAALKGFTHYLCLRRVSNLVAAGASLRDVAGKEISQAPAIAGLLSFIEQTVYDDIDTLKIDYRTVPRYLVTTTSNDCLRRKCPFYDKQCFVHGARERAYGADILVTNHSLLFCNVAADGSLLPPIRHWVVDEAHGAETEARKTLSPELSAEKLLREARRLGEGSGNTIFKRIAMAAARTEDDSTLITSLSSKTHSKGLALAQAAAELAAHFKDLLYFEGNRRSKGYEYVDIWLNSEVRGSSNFQTLASFARVYYDAAERFVAEGQTLVGALDEIPGVAVPQQELSSLVLEVKDMMNAAEVIFFNPSDAYAYAARISKKSDNPNDTLQALMVNVGEALNDQFYEQTSSVVFASATLAIKDEFTAFEDAVGLHPARAQEKKQAALPPRNPAIRIVGEDEDAFWASIQESQPQERSLTHELLLPSSYDFDRNMTVYVIEDMPEPNASNYLAKLQELLIAAHRAQNGSMLTLFTNRKEMEQCFNVVQPALKTDDLRVVCQKWGTSVKGLRDDFLSDKHLSLFALKSFWEGFDAPGATLRGVIIPKLPFGKPTDPLSCERGERDRSAWYNYVLPAAIIETKQAAGRLIRSAEDKGSLIFADKRLLTKSYGDKFLKSMPSKTIRKVTMHELARSLESCPEA